MPFHKLKILLVCCQDGYPVSLAVTSKGLAQFLSSCSTRQPLKKKIEWKEYKNFKLFCSLKTTKQKTQIELTPFCNISETTALVLLIGTDATAQLLQIIIKKTWKKKITVTDCNFSATSPTSGYEFLESFQRENHPNLPESFKKVPKTNKQTKKFKIASASFSLQHTLLNEFALTVTSLSKNKRTNLFFFC